MAASVYDALLSPAAYDPYGVGGGMRRRVSYLAPNGQVAGTWLANDAPSAPAPAPYDPNTDPDNPDNPDNTRNSFQRGVTSGVKSLEGSADALKGLVQRSTTPLGQQILGGPEDAARNLASAHQRLEEAQALGPRVEDLNQIHGAGDVGSYLAGKAGELVPQAPLFLAGGGIGGGIAKGVAGGLARRAVARGVEDYATGAAERALASGALKAAPEVVEAQGADAATQAAKDQFAENLQNRAVDMAAPKIAATQAKAQTAGSLAGQLVANYPSSVGSVYGALADDPEAQKNPHLALKALAGGAAADLATVLPFHNWGGGAAAGQITKAAEQKYLPKVVAATLKHGNLFGLGNAGATAAAIATHKWVDDNYKAVTPENFQALLGAYANGAVLGGALGGGKAAAGVHLPTFGGAHLDMLRGLAGKLPKFGHGGEEIPLGPEEPVAPAGGGETPDVHPGALSMLQRVYSKIKDPDTRAALKDAFVGHYGELKDAFQEGKDALGPLASRMFRTTLDKVKTPEARAEATDAFADTLGDFADKSAGEAFQHHLDDIGGEEGAAADTDVAPPAQRPQDNPVKLDSPIENILAAYIPHDSPLWAFPETIKPLARSAAKLFQDEPLNAQDSKNLEVMEHLVGKNNVDQWREAGPAYAAMSKVSDAVEHEAPASDTAMAEAYRRALDAQKAQAAAKQSPEAEATGEQRPDTLAPGVTETDQAPPTSTLAQRLDQAPLGTPEHAALQAELRQQVDQRGALVTENQSSPKAKAFWNSKDPSRHANTIEIEPKVLSGGATRRQALQLDNLVSAKMAEPDARGNTPDPREALVEVLGDIQAAGHTIDPKSITPGVFYKAQDGASYRLTPNDVLAIRYGLRDANVDPKTAAAAYLKLRQKLGITEPIPKPDTAEARAAALAKEPLRNTPDQNDSQAHPVDTRQVRGATEHLFDPADDRRVDVGGAPMEDTRIATNELGPRKPPPGAPEFTNTGDVARPAGAGNVADVTLHASPYEHIVNNTRRSVESAKTPAQRAEAKHAGGVAIGEAELAREREAGTISDKRFASEMKRLHDYSSGLSRKYLYDAANGKYDSGRVIEANDNPEIDRAAQREESHADRDIDEGLASAAAPQGPHDHAKETAMANALLEALGIKQHVKVEATKPGDTAGGRHVPSSSTIRLNPNLHGAERVEVIAHELGHHVFAHELAEATGLSRAKIGKMSADELLGTRGANGKRFGGLMERAGKTELRDAFAADYDKWLEGASDPEASVNDVMASRKPAFRGSALAERGAEETVAELEARDPKTLAYLHSFHEWVADNIARALTQQERPQGIIGKFFGRVADQLRSLYQHMFGRPGAERYAPAPSVDAWVKGLFDRTNAEASEALGRTTAKTEAQAAIEAAVHEALKSPAERSIEGSTRFFNYQLSPLERRVLARLTDRPGIQRQITARYGTNEELMRRLEAPETAEATHAFLAYNMWRRGELKIGPHPLSIMQSIQNAMLRVLGVATHNDAALRVFEDIKNGEIARLNQPDAAPAYDLRQRLVDQDAKSKSLQKAFNVAAKIGWEHVYEPWRKYAFGLGENIDKLQVPALSGLAAQIKRHTGESGNDPGMLPAIVRRRQNFHAEANRISSGLTNAQKTAVHEAMQNRLDASAITDPKVRSAVTAQRALLTRIREYMVKAGVPVGEIEKFYPVVMDGAAIRKNPQPLVELLNQPHFEKGIREYFSDRQGKPSDGKIEDLVQKMVRYASGAQRDADTPDTGTARIASEKRRLMNFIHRDGTPEDVQKFASLQHKDPAVVLGRYIDSAVRRAESVRRFGVNGEKIDSALEVARRQHARPEDIEQMKQYLSAAHGRYAVNGSPAVRKVFAAIGKPELGDKVNDKLFGPKGEGVQDMIMAYQNARVLPLALLSSLVDPLGIGVRYGGWKSLGDLHAHWTALKDGLLAASGGASMQHLRNVADAVGMADDYINTEILSNGYGGEGMHGLARKMSDAMFKYNGMNWWTKGTRYMALSMGQHFLLKHAGGAEPGPNGSARYLRELGVQASDVKRDPLGGVKLLSEAELEKASPEARAADERVRTALNRFVDESILRSDVSQHPAWMSDPAFRLVSQYKAFQYAFGDQILGRLHHEIQYANMHVLGPAMAYLPVTLAAETLRGFAQYGPGGNPHHKNWTFAEEAAFLNQRSGILGPRFTQLAKGYAGEGSSYADLLDLPAGPTVSQAHEIIRTAEGNTPISRTAVDALPASTLYRHWPSP